MSLKRLNRLDEARDLYERTVPTAPRQAQLMLRGNYAAALIESGEVDRAVGILQQLSKQHADSPETWGLLGNALWRARQPAEAIEAMQKAIKLGPRNGNYRIMLAKFLMEGPRDIAGAARTLDVAYGLGSHTREWVIRTLACHLLLDNRDQVAELLALLRRDVSEEEAESAFEAAVAIARKVAHDANGGDPAEAGNDHSASAEQSEEALPERVPAGSSSELAEVHATGQETASTPSPSAPETDVEDYRARIRAGVQPHLQLRFSAVDNSMLFDFYYGIEQPNYAAAFAEALAKVQVGMMGEWGGMQQRGKAYAFAKCPSCGVVMLTRRDEGERYSCQGCGDRVAGRVS